MNTQELFSKYFESIHRQGPGNTASTIRAFQIAKPFLPDKPLIADIGCGKGVQTIDLARQTNGQITAVDIHQPFLDSLEQRAAELNLTNHIRTLQADMNALPFSPESLDLIWAEGSIFITGFENGLKNWRRFLKPGGIIAFSESVWFSDDAPDKIRNYWNEVYPDIQTIEASLELIGECGYEVIGHFSQPKECWLDEYYYPQEAILDRWEPLYEEDPELSGLLKMFRREIEQYKQYGDYYGYEFFIIRKP
jgi:ubiquinone/menaquinone biosynthesis C-methylase UbiE